jgi:hypothetical protein
MSEPSTSIEAPILIAESVDIKTTMVGPYTLEQIMQMRRMGAEKPAGITWRQWFQPQRIRPRTMKIIWMMAQGVPHKKIAAEVGISYQRIKAITGSKAIMNEVQKVQYKLYGENPQRRFAALLPKAISVAESIMDNEKAKDSTRLAAAETIMDRALGKPAQSVEVNHNTNIKLLFEMLDKKKNDQIAEKDDYSYIEFENVPASSAAMADVVLPSEPSANRSEKRASKSDNPNDIIIPNSGENPNLARDEVDAWLDQNL